MESASSPHWCPRPRHPPALRSGCAPAEVTALAWHLGETGIARGRCKCKRGESALQMFPEQVSGPIFLLVSEKQEKNRQPLSVAQAHIDSHSRTTHVLCIHKSGWGVVMRWKLSHPCVTQALLSQRHVTHTHNTYKSAPWLLTSCCAGPAWLAAECCQTWLCNAPTGSSLGRTSPVLAVG